MVSGFHEAASLFGVFGGPQNDATFEWSGFLPIGSMYGLFTYIWLMVNVGKYSIHGSYGLG